MYYCITNFVKRAIAQLYFEIQRKILAFLSISNSWHYTKPMKRFLKMKKKSKNRPAIFSNAGREMLEKQ
jgi:hypothetical protein